MRQGEPSRSSAVDSSKKRRGGRPGACEDCHLIREADHRIANHLALLSAYARLKARELARRPEAPSRADVGVLLDAISGQIDAMARLHRALTRSAASTIDVGQELREVCEAMLFSTDGATRVAWDFPEGWRLAASQFLPLMQIVSELLTNSLKHAHPAGEPGRVWIWGRPDSAGGLTLRYVDDGVGLPEGFDPRTHGGLGFRLMRALADQLGAEVAFSSRPGELLFELSVPARA